MRVKIAVLLSATVMFTALGALQASPSFATDYFVKDLNKVQPPSFPCSHLQPSVGPNHGRVVFRRTSTSMFATVYLKNASPNAEVFVSLVAQPGCHRVDKYPTTDSNGNLTVQLGPVSRQGAKSFYAGASVNSGETYETDLVPASGF